MKISSGSSYHHHDRLPTKNEQSAGKKRKANDITSDPNSPPSSPVISPKRQRANEFPGSYVLRTGKELHPARHDGMHIADLTTALVMDKLINEGEAFSANYSAQHGAAMTQKLEHSGEALQQGAKGKLTTLTQLISLSVSATNKEIKKNATDNLSLEEWIKVNDKAGYYMVMNGNNDESYVNFIAENAKKTQELKFITSGFGGHGTTDRHSIAINKTEGDRFKEILVKSGIDEKRIFVDPWSTNSGQNAINVAGILNKEIKNGKAFNKVIIAGTPAAVLRQTYTYAKQLNIRNSPDYLIDSFPFFKEDEYNTMADNLAVLREFSTTLNYMANSDYLPTDKSLYPDSFFTDAVDSIKKTVQKLESTPQENSEIEGERQNIMALKSINDEVMSRLKNNSLTDLDKQIIKSADDYFRNLFNQLELTFKRSNL